MQAEAVDSGLGASEHRKSSKEEFADLASKGALNFPVLCSLRVVVRKKPDVLDVFVVEATEQDLCPRAMPNASMDFLSQLLISLPADPNRMLVAPVSAVHHIQHSGMVVDTGSPTPL